MGLIEMIVAVAFIGLFVGMFMYVFGDKMPDVFKRAVYALSVLLLVIILLKGLGLMPHLGSLNIK
jgi:hypothetical protein